MRVYLALRHAQMTGRFSPGQAFAVRALVQNFGTSVMPVREALRLLVAEQALAVNTNRMIIVPLISRERLADLAQCRQMIEGSAARWAVRAGRVGLYDSLEKINDAMKAAAKKGNVQVVLERNQQFHFTLYSAGGSAVIMPLIESLWLQAGPYLNSVRDKILSTEILSSHDEILHAVKARDPEGTSAAIQADIANAAALTLNVFTP
jgi:DNA-binding GntR family transcriptional regulator